MKNNKKLFAYMMLIAVGAVLFLYLLGTVLLMKREKAINVIEKNNETVFEYIPSIDDFVSEE